MSSLFNAIYLAAKWIGRSAPTLFIIAGLWIGVWQIAIATHQTTIANEQTYVSQLQYRGSRLRETQAKLDETVSEFGTAASVRARFLNEHKNDTRNEEYNRMNIESYREFVGAIVKQTRIAIRSYEINKMYLSQEARKAVEPKYKRLKKTMTIAENDSINRMEEETEKASQKPQKDLVSEFADALLDFIETINSSVESDCTEIDMLITKSISLTKDNKERGVSLESLPGRIIENVDYLSGKTDTAKK